MPKIKPCMANRQTSCGLSYMLDQQPKKQNTTTNATLQGTLAHKIAKYCLNELRNPLDFAGKPSKCGQVIDSQLVHNVKEYVDYVRGLSKGCIVYIEKDLGGFNRIEGASKKMIVDCLIIDNQELRIIDFKMGNKRVEVKDNLQLTLYAFAGYYLAKSLDKDITKIHLTIHQPPLKRVVTETLTVGELLKKEEKAKKLLTRDETQDFKANPSIQNCMYCIHKSSCVAFNRLEIEPSVIANIISCSDDNEQLWDTLTDDRKVDLYKTLKLLKNHADKVIKNLEEDVKNFINTQGGEYEGVQITLSSKHRKWTYDMPETLKRLEELGINTEYALTLKSPSQLEKNLGCVDYEKMELVNKLTTREQGATLKVMSGFYTTTNIIGSNIDNKTSTE